MELLEEALITIFPNRAAVIEVRLYKSDLNSEKGFTTKKVSDALNSIALMPEAAFGTAYR